MGEGGSETALSVLISEKEAIGLIADELNKKVEALEDKVESRIRLTVYVRFGGGLTRQPGRVATLPTLQHGAFYS